MEYFYPLATILLLWFLAILSPGPNFALVSRVSVSHSRGAGVAVSFGVAVSATIYAVLTLIGLAQILGEYAWLTIVIQLLGGVYLIYLGISSWLSAKKLQKKIAQDRECLNEAPENEASENDGRILILPGMPISRAFFSGLIVGLSNPKEITFFVSIFALLVPIDAPIWMKVLLVSSGFLIEVVWYALVAMLFSTARSRKIYQRFGVWIERVFGVLLTTLGLRLLWQARQSLQGS